MSKTKFVTIRLNQRTQHLEIRHKYCAHTRNKTPKRNRLKLSDFPSELHGLTVNKYGGQQLQNLRGLRGARGNHGSCRELPKEEAQEIAEEMGIPLSDNYSDRKLDR